jgi:ubiquinol-cytochrome c reductase cytochrome b subunit
VKDTFGVAVFLVVFSIVVFFMPEGGGYFLEANNFIAADPLKTPPHIAPVWYFTPYYSILRATTESFIWALALGVVGMASLVIWSVKNARIRIGVGVLGLLLLGGLYYFEAKVWGVILMGTSVMIFFLLPWLDRSPVKSIRYKGPLTKVALGVFVITFFVLGYLGTQAVTEGRTFAAQVGTAVYFLFFFLMPWWSKMDKCKPEPQRVTGK